MMLFYHIFPRRWVVGERGNKGTGGIGKERDLPQRFVGYIRKRGREGGRKKEKEQNSRLHGRDPSITFFPLSS